VKRSAWGYTCVMSLALYGVVFLLVSFGIFLCLLLIPLPKSAVKVLIALLSKLNSPMLFWPSRIFFVLLLVMLASAYADMRRKEVQEVPTENQAKIEFLLLKFRTERTFYLTCFATAIVTITWRLQAIMRYQKKLEEEVEGYRAKLSEVKKNR